MKIIYGCDVPHADALELSGLPGLSDHRSYLCDEFFNKVVANPNDKLHELLPYNFR